MANLRARRYRCLHLTQLLKQYLYFLESLFPHIALANHSLGVFPQSYILLMLEEIDEVGKWQRHGAANL